MMVAVTRTLNSKVALFYFGGTCEKIHTKPHLPAWHHPWCKREQFVLYVQPHPPFESVKISVDALWCFCHIKVLLESGTWCPENWLCFEKFAQWLHIHVKKKWVVLVNKSKSWAIIPLLTSALYLRKESIVFEVVYNDCLFWAFPGCPTKVPDGDHRNHLSF